MRLSSSLGPQARARCPPHSEVTLSHTITPHHLSGKAHRHPHPCPPVVLQNLLKTVGGVGEVRRHAAQALRSVGGGPNPEWAPGTGGLPPLGGRARPQQAPAEPNSQRRRHRSRGGRRRNRWGRKTLPTNKSTSLEQIGRRVLQLSGSFGPRDLLGCWGEIRPRWTRVDWALGLTGALGRRSDRNDGEAGR